MTKAEILGKIHRAGIKCTLSQVRMDVFVLSAASVDDAAKIQNTFKNASRSGVATFVL